MPFIIHTPFRFNLMSTPHVQIHAKKRNKKKNNYQPSSPLTKKKKKSFLEEQISTLFALRFPLLIHTHLLERKVASTGVSVSPTSLLRCSVYLPAAGVSFNPTPAFISQRPPCSTWVEMRRDGRVERGERKRVQQGANVGRGSTRELSPVLQPEID